MKYTPVGIPTLMHLCLLLGAGALVAGSPAPRAALVRPPLRVTAPPLCRGAPPIPPPPPLVAPRPSSPTHGPVVLGLLLLLYVINQWARWLPSYLVRFPPRGAARELMNVDLGLDETQYGLLMSYGFSLVYAACSAPAGWVCDRLPRERVVLLSALGWAVATAAQAASRTFGQLLGARAFLGFSQAFSGPAAHTLISEAFPPAERATANAIYSSGIYFGAALASVSVALAHAIGWRATSLAVSATSLAACMLLVLVWPSRQSRAPGREAAAAVTPPRAQEPAAMAATAGGAASPFRRVLSVGSVRLLLAAVAVRFFAGFAIGAWTPPFYRAAFPSHTREFALWNAVIVAGGGSLSAVAGGVLCDRLSRGGRPHRAVLVPLIGSLVAAPFWVLAMQARSFYTSIGALFCAYLAAESWFGASIALLQGSLSPAVWGTAQGLLNMVQVVGNASPILVAALVRRGYALRLVLSLLVPLSYLACALLFGLAGTARKAELE